MTRPAVTVFLDGEGTAKTIRASLDRHVDADELGAAVIAADAEAARAFVPGPIRSRAAPAAGEVCPSAELLRRAGLTGELIDRFIRSGSAPVTQAGPVRLVLRKGRITMCQVDPAWLAKARPASVTDALQAALVAARATHHRRERERDRLFRELDRTLADVRATLRSIANG